MRLLAERVDVVGFPFVGHPSGFRTHRDTLASRHDREGWGPGLVQGNQPVDVGRDEEGHWPKRLGRVAGPLEWHPRPSDPLKRYGQGIGSAWFGPCSGGVP